MDSSSVKHFKMGENSMQALDSSLLPHKQMTNPSLSFSIFFFFSSCSSSTTIYAYDGHVYK